MLCVPIKKKAITALIKESDKAHKIADIIEVWFDELSGKINDEVVRKILKKNRKPIIYKSTGNLKNIKTVLKNKIAFIDLDIATSQKTIKYIKKNFPKTKIIISYHNFKETPDTKKLRNMARKIHSKGADIIKLATYAKTISDGFRILAFLQELSKDKKAICICMGKFGTITRTAGHLFGNYLMYAPLSPRTKTAEGQITAKELKRIQGLISKSCH